MAIDLDIRNDERSNPSLLPASSNAQPVWSLIQKTLEPVASLRLTVALFAMSIMLVMVGTLAQVDKDIWEVIGTYFRCWVAWVPAQVFIPPSFVIPQEVHDSAGKLVATYYWFMGILPLGTWKGDQLSNLIGFWFPGGKLIGLLLAANLLSAHLIRFKANASGIRLWCGVGVIAIGCALTWLIIQAAGNSKAFQTEPWIPYSTLWVGFQGLLGLMWLGMTYAAVQIWFSARIGNGHDRAVFLSGLLIFAATAMFVLLAWLLLAGAAARPSDSSLRILWQLTQGAAVASVLLGGCWVVFGKRSGVVVLHAGIGLLMFYELHVAMTAVETQMQMEENETTNFVQDIRTFELAVIDKTKAGEEQVTAIPRSMIAEKKVIDLPSAPFRVQIDRVLQNSHLRAASSRDKNPATAGLGKEWFAEPKKAGSGTDMDSKVDMAAAYVTLISTSDGKPMGTYLVGTLLSMSGETDSIRVGEQTFELSLRPKRYYKPFQFRLKDVRKEDYIGTSTPRSYASTVRIIDPTRNVDEEKTIWMNNPLRFANETFYQSGYTNVGGVEHTTLSVVANSGWMMPYVACMLVSLGMLAHFLIMLVRFLMRTEPSDPKGVASRLAERLGMKSAEPVLVASHSVGTPASGDWASVAAAAVIVVLAGSYVISKAVPPVHKDLDYDLYRFGQIPVVQDGRVKPIDSAAYSALLTISGRTSVYVGDGKDKRTIPAIQWFLDVISENEIADEYEVFRVENLEVQETIGVRKREGMRYSRKEIRKKEREFHEQVVRAREVSKKDRRDLSIYQRKILELDDKVSTFDNLQFAFGLHHRIRWDPPEKAVESIKAAFNFERMLAEQGRPVFAVGPTEENQEWQTFTGAWLRNLVAKQFEKKPGNPTVAAWDGMLTTYLQSKMTSSDSKQERKRPQDFNREVDEYLKQLNEHPPRGINLEATRFEAFFNHFQPFTQAVRLYLVAFVIGACGWFGWQAGFNRTAYWLLVSVFALHTFALISRMYISGRPPVTNLYSSAVFIGWACVALGLVLEQVYKIGIGNLLAAVAGYATLLIADGLALKDDTFTVLQAVLDTQFWLSTHVTSITLGYATTYLAGLLGLVYVIRGVFTRSLNSEVGRDLNRMIYGTLCFSILFSFVGTVLGGLWADDSWGRFWGWDPKENGALIIVLWNALVLHARWGGMVKDRGIAVLAIVGNIFVSWSWWGVNELGAGLHSYGFTEGTVMKLGIFVLSQLVLVGIGLIPRQYWMSFRGRASVTPQHAG